MKTYRINGRAPVREVLEITAENEMGVEVRILQLENENFVEYRDFISRNLFEALVKTGYLREATDTEVSLS